MLAEPSLLLSIMKLLLRHKAFRHWFFMVFHGFYGFILEFWMLLLPQYLSRIVVIEWVSSHDLVILLCALSCNRNSSKWCDTTLKNAIVDGFDSAFASKEIQLRQVEWMHKYGLRPRRITLTDELVKIWEKVVQLSPIGMTFVLDARKRSDFSQVNFSFGFLTHITVADHFIDKIPLTIFGQLEYLCINGFSDIKSNCFREVLKHTRNLRYFLLIDYKRFTVASTVCVFICQELLLFNKNIQLIDLLGIKWDTLAAALHIHNNNISENAVLLLPQIFPAIKELQLIYRPVEDVKLLTTLLHATRFTLTTLKLQKIFTMHDTEYGSAVEEYLGDFLMKCSTLQHVSLKHLSSDCFYRYVSSNNLWEKFEFIENQECSICARTRTMRSNGNGISFSLAVTLIKANWLREFHCSSTQFSGAFGVILSHSFDQNCVLTAFTHVYPGILPKSQSLSEVYSPIIVKCPHLTCVSLPRINDSLLMIILQTCKHLKHLECRGLERASVVVSVFEEHLCRENVLETVWMQQLHDAEVVQKDRLINALLGLLTARCSRLIEIMLDQVIITPQRCELYASAAATSTTTRIAPATEGPSGSASQQMIHSELIFSQIFMDYDFQKFTKLTVLALHKITITDAELISAVSACRHWLSLVEIINCDEITADSLEFMVQHAQCIYKMTVKLSPRQVSVQNMLWVAMAVTNRGTRKRVHINTNGFLYATTQHELTIDCAVFPCSEEVVAALAGNRYFRVETLKIISAPNPDNLLFLLQKFQQSQSSMMSLRKIILAKCCDLVPEEKLKFLKEWKTAYPQLCVKFSKTLT